MEFKDLKRWLISTISDILRLMTKLSELTNINDNITLKKIFNESLNLQINNNQKRLSEMLNICQRNKMKCVVFGSTSNGKSATINAILGQEILPSSKGRTTSCFISVEGVDENNGYIINANGKRNSIDSIKRLTNQLINKESKFDSIIQLLWPNTKCPLLKKDLVLVDSPGFDYSTDCNNCINQHCNDADIYLLIIDGQSTLNESERKFFINVKEKNFIPNIFILVNKWDNLGNDIEEVKLKQQHLDTINYFLSQDLNISATDNIFKQIYFVSALNVLQGEDSEFFNKFKDHFIHDLTRNSMNTKFRPHLDNSKNILSNIIDFIKEFLNKINIENEATDDNIKRIKNNIDEIIENFFKEMPAKIKSYMEDSLERIYSEIERAKTLNTDTAENTKYWEVKFPELISTRYSNYILELEKELISIYVQNSMSKLSTENEMEAYFMESNDLKQNSKEYIERLKLNIKETIFEIINSQKNPENGQSFDLGFQGLLLAYMILRGFRKISSVTWALSGLGLAVSFGKWLFSKSKKIDLIEETFNKSKGLYDENQEVIKSKVKVTMEHFSRHQKQIADLYLQAQNIKIECENLLQNVSNKTEELQELYTEFQ